MNFYKNNSFLIWWLIINIAVFVIIGFLAMNFIISLVLTIVFLISIIFSLSQIGEAITRYFLRAKPLKTKRDKMLLLPAYNLVYEGIKEQYPLVLDDIKIYIEESNNISAFALGRRTICITTGAMQTLNEEQIKGVLCHEFGHHVNNDTLMLSLLNCGGGVWSLLILSINIINLFLNGLISAMYSKYGNGATLMIYGIKAIKGIVNFITKPIEWVLMAYIRKQEFKADYVAYECEYGAELVEGLYTLADFSNSKPIGLIEKLKSSHPNLQDRINKLENLL